MFNAQRIDLNSFRTAPENRIFSGRPRGEEVRRKANLDSLEASENVKVSVIIPEDTFTLNLSFFLGLFSESVRKRGKAWFEKHYTFAGPQSQLDKMPYYIEQADKDAIPLPRVK